MVKGNVIAIVHSEWVKLVFGLANWKQKLLDLALLLSLWCDISVSLCSLVQDYGTRLIKLVNV